MEVWNWMCCFKYNFSSIGQINESACRPMCSDVKSSSLEEKSSLKQYTSGNKCSSTKVHHWISVMIKPRLTKTLPLNLVIDCHHVWVEVHRWIVLCTCTCMAESSAVNCPVHMADLEAKVQRWIQLSGTGQQSSSLKLVVTMLGQIHRWIVMRAWLRQSICIGFWWECGQCSGATKTNIYFACMRNITQNSCLLSSFLRAQVSLRRATSKT